VPIEALWQTHGLADGHAEPGQLGPPFVPNLVPGVPAIVVSTESLAAAYSLRADYGRRGETMAFFPGAVLAQLYVVMGDVRGAMSAMATVTQLLVAAGVLSGLAIVARLFRRQLALLSALGASGRFVLAVMWTYAVAHLVAGAVAGVALGFLAAGVLSSVISAQTGLEFRAELAIAELQVVCGFLGLAAVAAMVPALGAPSRRTAAELR
jgi:putative ABC transport system permease protein